MKHTHASPALALPLLALAACSGPNVVADPKPSPGIGTGATSDYVYYVAQKTAAGIVEPFVAELDGTRRRALAPALDGQTLWLEDYDGASVSPDGRHLLFTTISGLDASMRVFDVANGTVDALPISYQGINLDAHTAWSPDSERLVYLRGPNVQANDLRLYYPDSDQLTTPDLSLTRVNVPLAWSPDSSHFGVLSIDQINSAVNVDVFDRDGNRRAPVTLTEFNGGATAIAFSSSHVAATPGVVDPDTFELTTTLTQYDLITDSSRVLTQGSDKIRDVAYSPDGQWLHWTAEDNSAPFDPDSLYLADVVAGTAPIRVTGSVSPGDPHAITWNSSSTRLAWASTVDPTSATATQLHLTDLFGSTVSMPLPGFSGAWEIVWSPDGNWLACRGGPGTPIYVVEASSPGPVRALVFGGSASTYFGLQWTPDSQRLLWLNNGPDTFNVVAWEPGASAIARMVGPNAAPLTRPYTTSFVPTADSTSVVWVKRDDQENHGIAVTQLIAPFETRVISSATGALDLQRVQILEVR